MNGPAAIRAAERNTDYTSSIAGRQSGASAPLACGRRWRTRASGFVVGFGPVQDALQSIEVALRRAWSVVEAGAANFALGLLDHRGRQLLQRLAGPHGVDLHLRGALQVIEPVIGVGHSHAERGDAVIGHEQHALVADAPG